MHTNTHTHAQNTIYNKRRNHETIEKTRPVNDIQYNEIIRSQVKQLMNSSQLKTISISNETAHGMITYSSCA